MHESKYQLEEITSFICVLSNNMLSHPLKGPPWEM